MHDLASSPPPPTRRITVSTSPIGSRGQGRETARLPAPSVPPPTADPAPPPDIPEGPRTGPAAGNREAAVMAEQRRLRRQLEASLREQLLTGASTTEDTIVCQLCELLWADHACLWMLPMGPDEACDWSRQTIVSEAVAEYYPLVGYSTCTPPEDWARVCLEPRGSVGARP